MTKFNDLFWKILFQALKPLTDNVGLVLIIYSVFFGVLFTGISYIYRKKSASFMGIFEGIYLLSVFSMLKHLPLIHKRINKALSTVSTIVLVSENYTQNLNSISGLSLTKPSQIVYYLYSLSLADLKKLTTVQPVLLYQKFYNAIKKTRYLLGDYIDGSIHLGVYFSIFIIIFFVTLFLLFSVNRIPWIFFGIQLFCLVFSFLTRNGCILSLFFLQITRIFFLNILQMVSFDLFKRKKIHINTVKRKGGERSYAE